MDEYIKRDSFLDDTMRKYCNKCERRKNANGKTVYAIGDAPCRSCVLLDLIDDIEIYPAADVRENVRGIWICANKGYLPMVFACSVCGGKHKDAADMFSFCPFCGSVMDDDYVYDMPEDEALPVAGRTGEDRRGPDR